MGIADKYIKTTLDERGVLKDIEFFNTEKFNFAYDIVDEMAVEMPEKLAMLHVDNDKNEKRFTFSDMSRYSSKTANYLQSLGIKKGDRVMMVLKRNYQFWFVVLALHKLGAVAIPTTHQLKSEDLSYRFKAGNINCIICSYDEKIADEIEDAIGRGKNDIGESSDMIKLITGPGREGWHSFDEEMETFGEDFERVETDGSDPMFMFFTSGTTGYPKIVTHDFTYPLGHYITARYWQNVDPDGLHFTLSDTGWAKALWGKLYGQWLCEAAVFTYDMESFVPHDFLSLFKEYGITTFCAPPTAYRVFVKRDLEKYGLSALKHVTTAGEALNAEVWQQFYDKTGLEIMEGFGQTETTLSLCNLIGTVPKPGSMGKPSPLYDVDIVDADGNSLGAGETGEVVIRTDKRIPPGLFVGYYGDDSKTMDCWYDDIYHTGDTAYRDADGYFWYVGRTDDLIKSCGYRVGPFEVESVLMELPYILECAVTGIVDRSRGQIVKATIVLVEGTKPSRELEKEIFQYAKKNMASYKCPRKIEFVDELPKTISGKIRRVEIRETK